MKLRYCVRWRVIFKNKILRTNITGIFSSRQIGTKKKAEIVLPFLMYSEPDSVPFSFFPSPGPNTVRIQLATIRKVYFFAFWNVDCEGWGERRKRSIKAFTTSCWTIFVSEFLYIAINFTILMYCEGFFAGTYKHALNVSEKEVEIVDRELWELGVRRGGFWNINFIGLAL